MERGQGGQSGQRGHSDRQSPHVMPPCGKPGFAEVAPLAPTNHALVTAQKEAEREKETTQDSGLTTQFATYPTRNLRPRTRDAALRQRVFALVTA